MKKKIQLEINQTCKFNAIRYSYKIGLLLLLMMFLLEVMLHISLSALFLLLVGVLCPSIIKGLQSNQQRKREQESFYLVHLQKKYGYTNKKYQQYAYSFFILMILLMVWQISCYKSQMELFMIRVLPSIIMGLIIGIRAMIFVFYYFYLPYKVRFNKLT